MLNRKTLTLCLFLLCAAMLSAEERDWSLMIGMGGIYDPIYEGSDTYSVSPLPLLDARYSFSFSEFFLSTEEGLGAKVLHENSGAFLQGSVNFGNSRSPEDAEFKDVLDGLPDLTNHCFISANAGIDHVWYRLYITGEYYPVKAEFPQGKTFDYDGFLLKADCEVDFALLENLFGSAGIGISWMNQDYAQSYHGVPYATDRFTAFDAGASFRDINGSLATVLYLTEHIGVILSTEATFYMGDAGETPLTESSFNMGTALFLTYTF